MNELQTLLANYNCSDALEVKEGIKPTEDFHARHINLTRHAHVGDLGRVAGQPPRTRPGAGRPRARGRLRLGARS